MKSFGVLRIFCEGVSKLTVEVSKLTVEVSKLTVEGIKLTVEGIKLRGIDPLWIDCDDTPYRTVCRTRWAAVPDRQASAGTDPAGRLCLWPLP